jgi:hypothetical protein
MANLAKAARAMTSKASCGRIALAASLTFGLGALNCAEAATITAASASFVDVSAAINSASDGDTVVVPAGTASWTSTLNITKGITLQGATTITGDHNTELAGTHMSANDQTIIVDNLPRTNGTARIILATGLVSTQKFRITGITFKAGTVTTLANNGSIVVAGTCPNVRLDHCHINNLDSSHAVTTYGWLYGAVDHCIFDCIGSNQSGDIGMDGYGGGSNVQGDGSWADGPNWGSNKFIFIEDNTFNNNGGTTASVWDASIGGRYVERYNVLNGVILSAGHGTEAIFRGVRAREEYGNIMYPTTSNAGFGGLLRSGTLLSYNNIWITSNNALVGNKVLENFRMWSTVNYWEGAYGANPWDINDTEGNGTYVSGHSPHVYYSGTATANSTNGVLTSSSANWTTNQWVGYSVFNTALTPNNSTGYIVSNTSNTITCANIGLAIPAYNIGNVYKIYKPLVLLDGFGRGKGDLIKRVSSAPVNSLTNTVSWTHMQLEPIYSWDSYNGAAVKIQIGLDQGSSVVENRDFYNLNTAWTPGKPLTTGVAVGTLANRPTQCTPGTDITGATSNPPGVAYWATDTGPSNQNGQVSGTLYVCTATNTWTQYYQPYVYPHPLVSSAPSPPSAPTNLHIAN